MNADRLRRPVAALVAGAALLALGACTSAPVDGARTVDLIEVEGVIDPPTSEYLRGRLNQAEADGVHAAVIQIDTPGGLDVSMREIIKEILGSEVPVVVWVAPRGSRAASAGTFIAYAANRVYMAESTELGAATPVNLGGGEQPEALERKVVNDAAAFIRELAITRGRNADWAEDAVREGASIGATEAVDIDVVDGMASSLGALLEAMDGERVEVADGEVTLETWDEGAGRPSARVRFQGPNLLQRLLHAVTSPEIAYWLMLIGFFGIIFELYNPGIGLAGILGAVCLLLGFYALSVLPTNWAGVLLVVLAIVFFVVDLQTAGLGVWTAGGIAALVAGALVLFAGAAPALALSPWAIAGSVALTLLFFVSVMTAALRVRLRRPVTGEEAMVGVVGEAKTDIAPEGTVVTKGTLWRARTMETAIAAGERVKVMATEGLVLLVEPLHDEPEPPSEARPARTHDADSR
ncbi:MAG TPA: nodulation protein NfeD [Actinomycetota bacterium]|nr:nodulation protein NfeD [Actinomycetota bacterium]